MQHYRYFFDNFRKFFFNGDNETKILFSEYSNEDLKHVVNLLCKCLYQIEFTKTGQKLAAVKKKYSESKVFIGCPRGLSKKFYSKFSSEFWNFDFGIFLDTGGKPYLWFLHTGNNTFIKTYSISTCAEISANREMILENARKAKDAKK